MRVADRIADCHELSASLREPGHSADDIHVLEGIEWVRKRQLASDARAGRWARAKARRLQHEYVRRHWRLLGGSAAAVLIPRLLALLLFPPGFPRGFVAGVLVAAVVGLMMFGVVQITGTGGTMMSVLAEQWTANELRTLRRGGWRVVNGAGLRPSDIDHVLIGPGGVFAIETKWSSDSWELTPPGPYVLDAITQAQGNAADLQKWYPFHTGGAGTVQPVVMLWDLS